MKYFFQKEMPFAEALEQAVKELQTFDEVEDYVIPPDQLLGLKSLRSLIDMIVEIQLVENPRIVDIIAQVSMIWDELFEWIEVRPKIEAYLKLYRKSDQNLRLSHLSDKHREMLLRRQKVGRDATRLITDKLLSSIVRINGMH